MDSTFLTNALAPAAAIIISLVTLILAQQRAQKTDDRAAAKDTVEILASQNTALHAEVTDLRARIAHLEQTLHDAVIERTNMYLKIGELSALLLQSTALIRDDVASNTEVSKAAFHEANQAKEAIAQAMIGVADASSKSTERLSKLENESQLRNH